MKPRVRAILPAIFIAIIVSIASLSGCGNSGNESVPPKNWQVFLGEYESAINQYISLTVSNTNSGSPETINKLLLTITNMQSMAPKIAESLSNKELQDFLLRYGKISTRLSETANSP